jgi:hypothetical protein
MWRELKIVTPAAWSLSLSLFFAAYPAHSETIIVLGAPGVDGNAVTPNGGPGGDATATAASSSDSSNTATASGGSGGRTAFLGNGGAGGANANDSTNGLR